jgi:hypothetical protein
MSDQLYIFAEVLLNYNLEPCIHYNKHFMPLYLTCKTIYNKYFAEKWQVFDCDICHFRDVICNTCQLLNTKTCSDCNCKNCGISINLTGSILKVGRCDRCPKLAIYRDYDYIHTYYFVPMDMISSEWYHIEPYQLKTNINKIGTVNHKWIEYKQRQKLITNIIKPEPRQKLINNIAKPEPLNKPQINMQNKIREKMEEKEKEKEDIIIKNIKISNFKFNNKFQYKKINIVKNNYKHNGQQIRRQNQLKQPR